MELLYYSEGSHRYLRVIQEVYALMACPLQEGGYRFVTILDILVFKDSHRTCLEYNVGLVLA